MIEDHRTILRADIRTLSIQSRRIMIRPENLQQLFVADFGRIKLYLHDLSVPRFVGADIFVGGVRLCSSGVSDCGRDYALQVAKRLLDSPEAAGPECGFLCLHWERWNDQRRC